MKMTGCPTARSQWPARTVPCLLSHLYLYNRNTDQSVDMDFRQILKKRAGNDAMIFIIPCRIVGCVSRKISRLRIANLVSRHVARLKTPPSPTEAAGRGSPLTGGGHRRPRAGATDDGQLQGDRAERPAPHRPRAIRRRVNGTQAPSRRPRLKGCTARQLSALWCWQPVPAIGMLATAESHIREARSRIVRREHAARFHSAWKPQSLLRAQGRQARWRL
jgi:hypothetical protein